LAATSRRSSGSRRSRPKRRSRAAEALRGGAGTAQTGVATEALTGSPKRTIVEESEAWGADLIVVGSHGYHTWERMLLGSVSQSVAAHALCSVEIVRCRKP
jgi:nucleotide-binding universal stress UspA family protein